MPDRLTLDGFRQDDPCPLVGPAAMAAQVGRLRSLILPSRFDPEGCTGLGEVRVSWVFVNSSPGRGVSVLRIAPARPLGIARGWPLLRRVVQLRPLLPRSASLRSAPNLARKCPTPRFPFLVFLATFASFLHHSGCLLLSFLF